MSYDELLALVCDRGGYAAPEQAEQAVIAVLQVLASRLCPELAQTLADELPVFLAAEFEDARRGEAETFGTAELFRRVAERMGTQTTTARWDAGAVLSSFA
ncbi:DUF2267 domain-containing protein [Streptomyces sp. CB03238]|uniref:DUF2267 domain-containing protein n=1 Tax=Streptomyces sp. CB03238 TaxID=1907777 RepID=UPI0015C4A7C4|nr:DUF2267 domain-containing protein [Streptomyces sp. CB03238]